MGFAAWARKPQRFAVAEAASGPGRLQWSSWSQLQDTAAAEVGWVSRDRALGLPGIGHGIDITCSVIGTLVADAVKYADDSYRPVEVLPRPQVLVDPDPLWHGRSTWTSAVVEDLMADGNAFADKTADPDRLGYPRRLPLIPPEQVQWAPSRRAGVVGDVYHVGDPNGVRREVDPADMFHVAVGARSGKRMGRGILQRYQDLLRLMVVVERATFVVMRDGKPAGVLSMDVDMSTDELIASKAAFINGVRRDGIAALVKAEFGAISWNAEDLALIPAREHNLRLASDVTGVPPYLLGVPSEARVYANMEDEWNNFVRITASRYLQPIQDALTDCVPRGQAVRYNTDDLTRPSAATRWVNHRTAVEIGAKTIDEVRQDERMGPMPEGAFDDASD